MMVYYYHQMSDSVLRKKGAAHKFPLYTQMLKMECRKDIQTENFFLNQKEKPADSFFRRLNSTVLQNKRRIWVFVGFTVAFNLTPVYDYVMQNSRLFHRVRRSLKMEKIPESIREQGEYEGQR